MRVADALALARALGVARLDAQMLLAWKLGQGRAWLLAHDDAELTAADQAFVRDGLRRRATGEPLHYITGECQFAGLALAVNPQVLVPRPETEGLVDWALELLRVMAAEHPAPRVADLGTGSGAIALAIQSRHPSAKVLATDLSATALAVARGNAERLKLPIATAQGAWFDALGDERFNLIVSNPPYIAAEDVHLQALQHEPQGALSPGGDGMAALLALAQGAGGHLMPGGWLLLEHGHDQRSGVQRALGRAGFTDIDTRADLAGMPRLSCGRWPGG